LFGFGSPFQQKLENCKIWKTSETRKIDARRMMVRPATRHCSWSPLVRFLLSLPTGHSSLATASFNRQSSIPLGFPWSGFFFLHSSLATRHCFTQSSIRYQEVDVNKIITLLSGRSVYRANPRRKRSSEGGMISTSGADSRISHSRMTDWRVVLSQSPSASSVRILSFVGYRSQLHMAIESSVGM